MLSMIELETFHHDLTLRLKYLRKRSGSSFSRTILILCKQPLRVQKYFLTRTLLFRRILYDNPIVPKCTS